MVDLETAATDDLVMELRKRCDGSIIGLYHNKSETKESATYYWSGGNRLALGMVAELKDKLRILLNNVGAVEEEDG